MTTRLPLRVRVRLAGLAALVPPTLWAAAIATPLLYLVVISLRERGDFARNPLGFPTAPAWGNYVEAWTEGDLQTAFLNNLVVTVFSVAGVVGIASLAAYGIVRWRGRAGNVFYVFFVFGLVVPLQLGLPTLYKLWVQLGLVDSLPGVILIQIAGGLPLAIFLYSGFLLTVPLELEESARVDGAGDVRTFVSIVFPLLRPVTATVVILTSIGVWNDLIVALFFLQSPENQTLAKTTIGFLSAYNSNVPVVFACAVLTVAPIIVLFAALQRFFVSGLTQGALRG